MSQFAQVSGALTGCRLQTSLHVADNTASRSDDAVSRLARWGIDWRTEHLEDHIFDSIDPRNQQGSD